MRSASENERLRLIRAHPELAGRAELTDESTCKQKGACFAQRNVEEFKRMQDTLYEPFAMGRFPRSAKTRRAAIAAEKPGLLFKKGSAMAGTPLVMDHGPYLTKWK